MAIRTIEVENFRSQKCSTFELSHRNEIRGRNGAGKSSIKEAIAFGFCGTDSLGTKNPKHLIRRQSDDKEGMKVKIITDKAEIQRSLSKKGNSTIKVIREGVPTTVTQSQLEGMLGPTDVVLSAIIPGYFCRLSADRQNKALSDVLPAVDRAALFEELAGFELTSEEKVRYGLSRRLDLVASSVATDRREIEKAKAHAEGELKQLMATQPVPRPAEPPELAHMSRYNVLRDEWDEYDRKMREYSSYKVRRERVVKENEEREEQIAKLKDILRDLREIEEPEVEDITVAVQELMDAKRSVPPKPSVLNLPSGDHCSACGQVVGVKHREKVAKQNEEALAEYESESQAVKVENERLQDAINQLYQKENAQKKAREEAIHANKLVRQKKQRIEIELASLRLEPLPEIVKEPTPPEEAYDEEEHAKAQDAVQDFRLKEREYANYQLAVKRIELESEDLKNDIKGMEEQIDRMMNMERVFKLMPRAEMERQASELNMPNVEFKIDSKIEISRTGTPYELLSTGYQMRTDIEICAKFNSLMKRPMNMVYIDDAELMDEVPEGLIENLQIFVAKVDGGVEEVTISELH